MPAKSSLSEQEENLYEKYQLNAPHHWLYRIVPRHRSQIKWYDWGHWFTWALFGNDDEGVFSEAQTPLFRPEQPIEFTKALAWMLRNPLHNFCFYVIGSAGRQNDELAFIKINRRQFRLFEYSPVAKTVFAGRYNSFFLGLHGGKPFVSLRIAYGSQWKSDFYIGWRERGNFGIKFLPLTKVSLVEWDNLDYKD